MTVAIIGLITCCNKKGCTYEAAENYDASAEVDDGSCDYYTVSNVQEKLVGTWSGGGMATFSGGSTWQATFVIDTDGHYSAHITSVQTGSMNSVFDNGNDNLDSPEKKIVMQSIDAFGQANGKVSFIHGSGSIMQYQIKDLIFSNDNSKIDFTVSWGAEIVYSLNKM